MHNTSKYVNKAILPVNFKGVISYIIEKFPKNIEIVIPIRHLKHTVQNYVALAHPDRKFTFVEVDKYIGPGYSLLKCKDKLQCPFIVSACDTIVTEDIPQPDCNWLGISPIEDNKTKNYCTVSVNNNFVSHINDKKQTNDEYAFVGLSGVKDYDVFFSTLETNTELIENEIQLSNAFKYLIEKKLSTKKFTWYDTGTLENYKKVNKILSGSTNFDFSKENEFIYFINDRVIKFFADDEIVKKRVRRAEILNPLTPKILEVKENFYVYEKVPGETLYNILNDSIFRDFLKWAKINLWIRKDLNEEDKIQFYNKCRNFYLDKTLERCNMFYGKTNIVDTSNNINGIHIPPLKEMLEKINWNDLSIGVPSNFHGDLQFDNILSIEDTTKKFILLDWRQDFSGLDEYGDLYYDLAKLYGGLILSYQLVKQNMFFFESNDSNIYFDFFNKNSLIESKEFFEEFIIKNGYDMNKVKILTALIFLNMAPLHNAPFDSMLYYVGKYMLNKFQNGGK